MKLLTVNEACERLRCSRWTLDRRFRDGHLTKVKSGRAVLIPEDSVESYLRRNSQPAAIPGPRKAEVA